MLLVGYVPLYTDLNSFEDFLNDYLDEKENVITFEYISRIKKENSHSESYRVESFEIQECNFTEEDIELLELDSNEDIVKIIFNVELLSCTKKYFAKFIHNSLIGELICYDIYNIKILNNNSGIINISKSIIINKSCDYVETYFPEYLEDIQ